MKTITNLYEKIEKLINNCQYEEAANTFSKELDIELINHGSTYKTIDWDDKTNRYVFSLELLKGFVSYKFEFGQSIDKGNSKPTMYDVLACLTKYDPKSFEEFCSDFGYDEDSIKAEGIYNNVSEEWDIVYCMFKDEELDILKLIQ